MINLIPPKAKKSLVLEYWVRVVSVWMMLWAATLFLGASILFPAYVLISSQVDVYASTAAEASEKVASFGDVSASLVDASQEAQSAKKQLDGVQFSAYIDLFGSLEGETIEITEMNFDRSVDGFGPVLLSGVAANRQALASFRDRLLEKEIVTSVDLPISNLARDRDIPFNVTVELVNENNV